LILIELRRGRRAAPFLCQSLEHDPEHDGNEVDAATVLRLPGNAVESRFHYRGEGAQVERGAYSPAETEIVPRLRVGRVGFAVVVAGADEQVGLRRASRGGDDEIAAYSPKPQIRRVDIRPSSRRSDASAAEGMIHPVESEPDRQLSYSKPDEARYGFSLRLHVSEFSSRDRGSGCNPDGVALLRRCSCGEEGQSGEHQGKREG
jgi:hypothetical protein